MQAIAVSRNFPKLKTSNVFFSFLYVFFSSNPLFFSLVLSVHRHLKMPLFPSRSSDSSVSCVWSSCWTVRRGSVTCCGPSSSPFRSVTLWSWSFLFFISTFNTLWMSWLFGLCLQALPHVALLIVMLFFIYAVIGMQVQSSVFPFWM